MLYKMSEWESDGSGWHCGCLDNLAKDSNLWYLPARILNITPAAFVELLATKYQPDYFYYNPETGFLSYSWSSQTRMRSFKNWINAEARKVNFQI